MTQHAFLSPSAAHRWLNCTMAPSLEDKEEDKGSVYADEGTLAHAICEAKLKAYLTKQYPMYIYQEEHGCLWTDEALYKEEMEETSDYYRDVVVGFYEEALKTTPDAKLLIEQKVKITDKLFGTADALIIADGLCNVIDYKHGKGVEVSAEDNPQMKIYAVGAWLRWGDDYEMEEITMTIVQPRLYNTSSWNISVKELSDWHSLTLIPTAVKILQGRDLEQKAGSWCKFCKVKGRCKALASLATDTQEKHSDTSLLTVEEIASLIEKVDTIKQWCESFTENALQIALDGTKIEGYKVVEGRSKRVISDARALVNRMHEAGVTDEAIFKPRELNTLTTLEKMIGKKKFAEEYGEFVTKPKGKPTLVPESDKRPPYDQGDIEKEFGDIQVDN